MFCRSLFERIIRNNEKKIWNIWKKHKLNSEKIGKIWKKSKLNSEKNWKIWKKRKLNSDKTWNNGRKISGIVKRYEKYGREVI